MVTITTIIKRGDIYYADLSPAVGSEQGGVRPVVIIQNDVGNKFSPTTIAVPMTSRCKNKLPTHVEIKQGEITGLYKDSIILGEQIHTIDKKRLKEKIGELDAIHIIYLNQALLTSLSIVQ